MGFSRPPGNHSIERLGIMGSIANLRGLLSEFQAEVERIHSEMVEAESLAQILGIAVPWKPAAEPVGKRRYRSHKDARYIVQLAADKFTGHPFTQQEITARINVTMAADGRPPFTPEAVGNWLRTLRDDGSLVKTGENLWRVA
jgi:hypothetical protein